ncbi:MAG TPA: hypothetical protein VF286_10120, partial [Acidiphilium sp.]
MTLVFAILLATALLGSWLAANYLRDAGMPRFIASGPLVGAIHGAIGIAGFIVFILTLIRHPPAAAMGLGSFGIGAEILFAFALILGLGIATMALRGRRPFGFLI